MKEIHIGLEGYKSSEIIKEISDGEFIEKEGKTFVKVKNRGQVWIKIGIRKNAQNIWKDSIEFRVRELPKPKPQMGTIQNGAVESYGTIMANASRIFLAMSNFTVEGIRANVISFRFSVLDTFGFNSIKIKGNYINGAAQNLIRKLRNGAIYIDEIYYVVLYNGDTIFSNLKCEDDVFIKVRQDENKTFNFGVKGGFLERNEPIIFTNVIDKNTIFNFLNYTKHGLWTDSFFNPQYYFEEFYDSGKLTEYRVFDADGFKKIDLKIPKNSDSVYYQEFYEKGKTHREGWVTVNEKDYHYFGRKPNNNECGNYDRNGFEWFFGDFKFIPISNWKEYYESGNIKLDSKFMKIKDYTFYRRDISNYEKYPYGKPETTEGYSIFYDGLWKIYNEDGKLKIKYLYEEGNLKKIN